MYAIFQEDGMKKRFWRKSMLALPMMAIAFCSHAIAASNATLTISSTGTPISSPGTITVAFSDSAGHTYSETAPYGLYSSPASLAAWFGAAFSKSYVCPSVGNCTGGLGAHANGSVITFQLNSGASFGWPTITNPSASFTFNLSSWPPSTPIITWPTPAAISYGTALSATQLDATATVAGTGASVSGTFSYSPVAGVVLPVGSHTINVTFTPTNSTVFTQATATTSLVVNSALPVPTITWPTPATLTFTTSRSATLPIQASIIQTLAGSGTSGYAGDGGAGTSAKLANPRGVALDSAGNIYIVDEGNNCIRKVNVANGNISTVAGTGVGGYSGDGYPATSAKLLYPFGVAVDTSGNLYIADRGNYVVRKVTAATGIISTVAGNGNYGFSGMGGPATSAEMWDPEGVAVDSTGNLYIADDSVDNRVLKVTASTGIISVFAGSGSGLYDGDNQPAISAGMNPSGVTVDAAGNVYIADNQRVRMVSVTTGIITTVAGNGEPSIWGQGSPSGDGGPATNANLSGDTGLAVDSYGNLYIADTFNERIRVVSASTRIITSLVGTGNIGFNGDGIGALSAELYYPYGVALDTTGNIYIADALNNRVRAVGAANMLLGPAQLDATASVPGSFVYNPAAGTPINGGVTPLSVTFTPSDTVHYATATATVNLTVNPATTTLHFAQIQTQTFGNGFLLVSASSSSSAQVSYQVTSGPATVTGNVVALTGAGMVVLSASQGASQNYLAPANATTSFVVLPATPSLAFTPIPEQTYGNVPPPVSATSASTGAVTYSVVSGPATISGTTLTITGTGTVTLSATQAATTNYTSASTTTQFPVNPATPVISWLTPTPITSGTALSTTQLDATASVAGSFSYSPGRGNVPPIGTQPLTVTFTPNSSNYNTATATVYSPSPGLKPPPFRRRAFSLHAG